MKNIFQKKLSTRKLNIREIWELHKLISKEGESETYLAQEAIRILENISTDDFQKSLKILYGDKIPKTPLSSATGFVEGLKKTEFFIFQTFVYGIINGNR